MSRLVKIHIYNERITNKEETFSESYRVRLRERDTLFQSSQNHCQACGHMISRDQGMLKKLLLTVVIDLCWFLVCESHHEQLTSSLRQTNLRSSACRDIYRIA